MKAASERVSLELINQKERKLMRSPEFNKNPKNFNTVVAQIRNVQLL